MKWTIIHFHFFIFFFFLSNRSRGQVQKKENQSFVSLIIEKQCGCNRKYKSMKVNYFLNSINQFLFVTHSHRRLKVQWIPVFKSGGVIFCVVKKVGVWGLDKDELVVLKQGSETRGWKRKSLRLCEEKIVLRQQQQKKKRKICQGDMAYLTPPLPRRVT